MRHVPSPGSTGRRLFHHPRLSPDPKTNLAVGMRRDGLLSPAARHPCGDKSSASCSFCDSGYRKGCPDHDKEEHHVQKLFHGAGRKNPDARIRQVRRAGRRFHLRPLRRYRRTRQRHRVRDPASRHRFLPAERRLRGEALLRRPHSGLVEPPRRPSGRKSHPDLPPDRPPAAPPVPQGNAQRRERRRHRHVR